MVEISSSNYQLEIYKPLIHTATQYQNKGSKKLTLEIKVIVIINEKKSTFYMHKILTLSGITCPHSRKTKSLKYTW